MTNDDFSIEQLDTSTPQNCAAAKSWPRSPSSASPSLVWTGLPQHRPPWAELARVHRLRPADRRVRGQAAVRPLSGPCGAFVAVERGDRDVIAIVERERLAERPPVTSSGVVGQIWRGGHGRQAMVARLLAGVDVERSTTRAGESV